ncbi:MAG: GTP-binding protein, partial [Bacillota bacterium]|nr:GTP-binding protein [Bacillota bacterium]
IIILEATGLAVPGKIRQSISEHLGQKPQIFTVVDALRWQELAPVFIPGLLEEQIKAADYILVNKTEGISEDILLALKGEVQELNPQGRYLEVAEGIDQSIYEEIIGECKNE